jgi:hypothetical protein
MLYAYASRDQAERDGDNTRQYGNMLGGASLLSIRQGSVLCICLICYISAGQHSFQHSTYTNVNRSVILYNRMSYYLITHLFHSCVIFSIMQLRYGSTIIIV